jgi:hypothetical protein
MTTDDSQPITRVPVPPPRAPARVDWAGRLETLRGQRVIVANEQGIYRGFYAWSELEIDADGHPWVSVVAEIEWWQHALLGHLPTGIARWPAGAVWLD